MDAKIVAMSHRSKLSKKLGREVGREANKKVDKRVDRKVGRRAGREVLTKTMNTVARLQTRNIQGVRR